VPERCGSKTGRSAHNYGVRRCCLSWVGAAPLARRRAEIANVTYENGRQFSCVAVLAPPRR
jgi:hypothetical protein